VLSTDDLQIVERDRDVPGLSTILDTGALLKALQDSLPNAGIRGLEASYVHYKPYTSCLIAGLLQTMDRELPFYAKAYGADGPIKLEKTRELQSIPSQLGPGTLILEDTAIGVYFFPVDHRLKGLRRLADPVTENSLLKGLLGKSHDFSGATLRYLRYKPERRFVARLESSAGPDMLLKFFQPARYKAAKRAAQAIGETATAATRRMNYFCDRHKAMALEWLPGRLLSDFILTRGAPEKDKVAAVEQTGAALAELHSSAPSALKRKRREDEIRRLHTQAATIAHLNPSVGGQAERLALMAESALERVPGEATALHGDFYDHQVLISDGSPVLLDLDEARLGHPAVDVGLFIAHLERHRLYDRLSAEEVGTYARALLRGYEFARPAPSESVTSLYVGIGLLHLAAEPFRYRDSAWRRRMSDILAEVEVILDGSPEVQPPRRTAV
jgi:Ser/Thr protein kinase RdoA (MazF antagonist)